MNTQEWEYQEEWEYQAGYKPIRIKVELLPVRSGKSIGFTGKEDPREWDLVHILVRDSYCMYNKEFSGTYRLEFQDNEICRFSMCSEEQVESANCYYLQVAPGVVNGSSGTTWSLLFADGVHKFHVFCDGANTPAGNVYWTDSDCARNVQILLKPLDDATVYSGSIKNSIPPVIDTSWDDAIHSNNMHIDGDYIYDQGVDPELAVGLAASTTHADQLNLQAALAASAQLNHSQPRENTHYDQSGGNAVAYTGSNRRANDYRYDNSGHFSASWI